MRASAFLVLLLLASPAFANGFGPGFAGGFAQGLADGQMRALCVEALQNYMAGRGPPPPSMCAQAQAAPPRGYYPQVTRCQRIGDLLNCTTY